MKERGIIFSAPMVRALLAGTKTQTRRALRMQGWDSVDPHEQFRDEWSPWKAGERHHSITCPYGKPGDRLWVRETFSGPHCMEASEGCAAVSPSKWGESSRIWYWADGNPPEGDWTRPRPSIHMPRWASRITLEITDVRVQRLQDISAADAIAEGVSAGRIPTDDYGRERVGYMLGLDDGESVLYRDERTAFQAGWGEINGTESWDANPWVWALSFRRIEKESTR